MTPARRRYLARIPDSLLDRIDIQVVLAPPSRADLRADGGVPESMAAVAARVGRAREVTAARLADMPWHVNARVPGPVLWRLWPLPAAVTQPAERAFETGLLTARGLTRVLQLAWTLADLAGHDRPGRDTVEAALDLRLPGRLQPV